jgi:hypothetical protein
LLIPASRLLVISGFDGLRRGRRERRPYTAAYRARRNHALSMMIFPMTPTMAMTSRTLSAFFMCPNLAHRQDR